MIPGDKKPAYIGQQGDQRMTCGCPLLQTGQRTVLAKSSFPSCSRLSAHSNIEMVAGFGFPFLLDGFSSGPSAKNSAQEKSDRCSS